MEINSGNKVSRTPSPAAPAKSAPQTSERPAAASRPAVVDGMDAPTKSAKSAKVALTPPAYAAADLPQVDLKRGSTQTAAVKQLQDALVERGYMTRAQVNTGYGVFGPRTEAAVKALQSKHGIPATGAYDAPTRTALAQEMTPSPVDGTAPTQAMRRGEYGPQVSQLQSALVATGDLTPAQVATGPGLYGPRTESAVRALQLRNGLEPTGRYDDTTRAALEKDLGALKDPAQLVGETFQKTMGRPGTEAELSQLTDAAKDVIAAGGTVRDIRQSVVSAVRATDEYKAAHPLGNGTVDNTTDANNYFLTQWGGTSYNSAQGAPYGYNDCGPTSGVMALSSLGLMERPEPDGAGTAIDAVRDAALGYDSTQSTRMGFATLGRGLEAYGAQTQMLGQPMMENLDAALDRGNPVIIGGNPWQAWGKTEQAAGNYLNSRDPGGHFVTLLGKTPSGNYIVGDPLVKGGTIEVTQDQLKTFFGSGFGAMEVSR